MNYAPRPHQAPPLTPIPPPMAGGPALGQPEEPDVRARVARYKTLARRALGHWKGAFLILVLGAAAAIGVAYSIKPTYRSECVVLFRAGVKLNEQDDSPTERAARVGANLKERLTTRSRLEMVIKEFNLYPKTVNSLGMLQAVEEMRLAVGWRAKGSDTFVISFLGENPVLVQNVTQRLSDSMIEEFTSGSLDNAKRSEAFLLQEEERRQEELESANRELAKFLAAHPEFVVEMRKGSGTAPGAGGSPLVMPTVSPTAAAGGDPTLARLYAQRERLERTIAAVRTGQPAPPAPIVGTPAQEARLAKARQDREVAEKAAVDARASLNSKRAQGLTDEHPDVRMARSALSVAEAQLVAATGTVRDVEAEIRMRSNPFEAVPANANVDALREQLASVNARITAHKGGRTASLDAGKFDEASSDIVELETMWQRLLRNYQSAREAHDDVKQRLDKARLELARAQTSTGDAMSILDPAYRPMVPAKGGKTKTALMGLAATIALAMLYAFGRVAFNDTIIDAQDVEALRTIPVLGSLPKLDNVGKGVTMEKEGAPGGA